MTTPLKQRIIDAVVGAHTDAEVARRAVVAVLESARQNIIYHRQQPYGLDPQLVVEAMLKEFQVDVPRSLEGEASASTVRSAAQNSSSQPDPLPPHQRIPSA